MVLFAESAKGMQKIVSYQAQFDSQYGQIKKLVKQQVAKTKKMSKTKKAMSLKKKYKSPYFMESLQELNRETRLYQHGQSLAQTVLTAQPGTGFGWGSAQAAAASPARKQAAGGHKLKQSVVENPFMEEVSSSSPQASTASIFGWGALAGFVACCAIRRKL